MKKEIENAFIAMLAGVAEWYSEREIKIGPAFCNEVRTVEFPTKSTNKVIVRDYRNDKLMCSFNMIYGVVNGEVKYYREGNYKYSAWYIDGVLDESK